MTYQKRLERLVEWIEASTSRQQVHARYRSAMKRDWIDTDREFALMADARDRALTRLAGRPTPPPRPATRCDDCGVPFVRLAETIPPGHILITDGMVIESAWRED